MFKRFLQSYDHILQTHTLTICLTICSPSKASIEAIIRMLNNVQKIKYLSVQYTISDFFDEKNKFQSSSISVYHKKDAIDTLNKIISTDKSDQT